MKVQPPPFPLPLPLWLVYCFFKVQHGRQTHKDHNQRWSVPYQWQESLQGINRKSQVTICSRWGSSPKCFAVFSLNGVFPVLRRSWFSFTRRTLWRSTSRRWTPRSARLSNSRKKAALWAARPAPLQVQYISISVTHRAKSQEMEGKSINSAHLHCLFTMSLLLGWQEAAWRASA